VPLVLLGAHSERYRASEEAVFCCFSRFRAVPFKVADCTDFSHKNVPTRKEMEDLALIIPVPPARKPAGFAGAVEDGADVDDEIVAASEERGRHSLFGLSSPA
jgi:hypothetical protein